MCLPLAFFLLVCELLSKLGIGISYHSHYQMSQLFFVLLVQEVFFYFRFTDELSATDTL